MQINTVARRSGSPRWSMAVCGLLAMGVAAALSAYAGLHPGRGSALFTLGFSSVVAMKSWLSTVAGVLVIVQVFTALGMWGKLPGRTFESPRVVVVHRWSGTLAFLVTLPVAFQCIWSLGFSTAGIRTITHSVAGCLFYGVFAAKMLGLRLKGLPGLGDPATRRSAGCAVHHAVVHRGFLVLHQTWVGVLRTVRNGATRAARTVTVRTARPPAGHGRAVARAGVPFGESTVQAQCVDR